ncbi:antitoxin MazE family protein [Arthrobacter sp. HLT1-21]
MAEMRDRVREHRQRLREQGLRPLQLWVPDVRSLEFAAEAHRQSLLMAASEEEAKDQAFVDAVTADWDIEADPHA